MFERWLLSKAFKNSDGKEVCGGAKVLLYALYKNKWKADDDLIRTKNAIFDKKSVQHRSSMST